MEQQLKKARKESWNVPASTFAQNTLNPIRRIVDGMKLTPNPDKEMIALSIGDPTVFGNLLPAEEVKEAIIKAVKSDKYNGYAPSVGYEKSRAAVAEYYSRPEAPLTAKDVIFASGCSGALDLCITVIANPGQNILIPRPGFSIYKTLAQSLGIHVKAYDLVPERCWEVDLAHLDTLVDEHTAAIVVNNPSNPCGSVYSRTHIRLILELCERRKLPIIADEIYADFAFPGHEYIPMATQTTTVPVLSCGGLTKRWVVPGWRMGWITVHDRNDVLADVTRGLHSLSQRILGPNTLVQGALEDILRSTPQAYYDSIVATCKEHADICYAAISKVEGLKPIMPQGAMYMMIGIDMEKFPFTNEMQFTERLVTEQSVFALPASCFQQYPNYFRVVLTVPTDKLRAACERIADFCATHYHHSNGTAPPAPAPAAAAAAAAGDAPMDMK